MAETVLHRRAALDGVRHGAFGPGGADGPGVTLAALPEGTVLHVLGTRAAVPAEIAALMAAEELDLRDAAPSQWFAVGDRPLPAGRLAALNAALAGRALAIDQSHGRVRIALGGRAVRRTLAKGTALDLDPVAFATGASATTLVGHLTVHLTRVADERFELMVLRGFAANLFEDLCGMAREFGLVATGAEG
ncbi:sarcosine oxidase subunit gamma family protein [Ensifer soli]|uniref:sarcosine oxidase subunit gamma family protein n=1 Tax=Ciceribacter sp. sgz301302 TaxID=3342379 RepID=UPI0035B81D49